jgi:hypothetical protein
MLRSAFIPGIELSRRFFHELVEPLIAELYPALEYGAALVGSGSEVLGFDDEVSSDHHWGPRLQLFLNERDLAIYGREIRERMSLRLPTMFHGYSTNFTPPDPEDGGTQLLDLVESGPVNHRVETLSLRGYCLKQLGIRPDSALSPVDWLTIPGQKLAAMTAGAVYRDDLGELTRLRHKLAYYPHDVWLYMLAAGWTRIGQEEAFVGRAGSVEDELVSDAIRHTANGLAPPSTAWRAPND